MDDQVSKNADVLNTPGQGRAPDDDGIEITLQDTLTALSLRQDKELVELQRLHNKEMQITVDADPEHVADLHDRQTHEYDDLREKHDNERKRYIRENEQANKILADTRAQENQMEIGKRPELGHDGPNITR